MILDDVFFLENQYWVSFYIGNTIYDSRFYFEPNSINLNNCCFIDSMQMTGILAKIN
jgi:hypothetical protein